MGSSAGDSPANRKMQSAVDAGDNPANKKCKSAMDELIGHERQSKMKLDKSSSTGNDMNDAGVSERLTKMKNDKTSGNTTTAKKSEVDETCFFTSPCI